MVPPWAIGCELVPALLGNARLGCALPWAGVSPSGERFIPPPGVTQRRLGQLSGSRPVAIRLRYRKGEQFIRAVIRRPPHHRHTAGTPAELLGFAGRFDRSRPTNEGRLVKTSDNFKKNSPFPILSLPTPLIFPLPLLDSAY